MVINRDVRTFKRESEVHGKRFLAQGLAVIALATGGSCILLDQVGMQSPAAYRGKEAAQKLQLAIFKGWVTGGQIYLTGLPLAPDLRSYSAFSDASMLLYAALPGALGLSESSYYDRKQVDSCADHLYWKSAWLTWQYLGLTQGNLRVISPLAPESTGQAPDDGQILSSSVYVLKSTDECKIEPGGVLIHSGVFNL